MSAKHFLAVLTPALESGHACAVVSAVRECWTHAEVAALLGDASVEVRQAAALVLGLVGDLTMERQLIAALRDAEEEVNRAAEHALWSIWFRAGNRSAARPFHDGVALLGAQKLEAAADLLTTAIRLDPGFGEAYNQRAIVHYLAERWESAVMDCCHAIQLRPFHFGAIAGLGHCFTQLNELGHARQCYRKALRINPRLDAVSEAIRRIDHCRGHGDSSGIFHALGVTR